MGFTGTSEFSSAVVGPHWLSPFLFAVCPTEAGFSFEVFRQLSRPVDVQAHPEVTSHVLRCHLQSEPQQLVTENRAKILT
jgi:hypothetical protein